MSAREPAQLGDVPAVRLLRRSTRLGFLASIIAFFILGCTVLIDQWIAGQVTAMFILGTALVLAGLCAGLFAVVAGTGLALSMLFDAHNVGTENQLPTTQQRSERQSSSNEARLCGRI